MCVYVAVACVAVVYVFVCVFMVVVCVGDRVKMGRPRTAAFVVSA